MIISTIFVLVLIHFASSETLSEDSLCELHTGETGVCKPSKDCTWLVENLRRSRMAFSDIRLCSFRNQNDIVCCRHEKTSSIQCDMYKAPNGTRQPGYLDDIKPGDIGYKARVACNENAQYAVDVNVLLRLKYGFRTQVVNGKPAQQGEVPHIVALGYLNDKNDYNFDCSGSLISSNWIITAAHCIKEKRKPVIARMGKLNLHGSDGFEAVDRTISEIIRHPKYSSIRKKNDIALIKFDGKVDFTRELHPACIRTDNVDVPPTVELTTAGWGSIQSEKFNRSKVLLKATVYTVPLEKCNETLVRFNELSDQSSLRGLIQSQMCALNRETKSDTCQGDSGGPLFTTESALSNKNLLDPCYAHLYKLTTLHGIVSFGVACGTELPGVYTRVASYIEWIESIVWP